MHLCFTSLTWKGICWFSSSVGTSGSVDQGGCPDPVAEAIFVFNEGAFIGLHDLHCDAQCWGRTTHRKKLFFFHVFSSVKVISRISMEYLLCGHECSPCSPAVIKYIVGKILNFLPLLHFKIQVFPMASMVASYKGLRGPL